MKSHLDKFDWYEPHRKWILGESDVVRANLEGANLEGAYLRGANLGGANFLEGFTGMSSSKVQQLTQVGSENGTLILVECEEGWFVNRGCFCGSAEEFLDAVEKTHGNNEHGKFYRKIIKLYCGIKRNKEGKGE